MLSQETIEDAISNTFNKVIRPIMNKNQRLTGMRDVSSGTIAQKITLDKVLKYGKLSEDQQEELIHGDYEIKDYVENMYPPGYYI